MSKKEYELGEYVVYVPENARTNLENKSDVPPQTEYEGRKSDIEEKNKEIKQLCGGKHGKTND